MGRTERVGCHDSGRLFLLGVVLRDAGGGLRREGSHLPFRVALNQFEQVRWQRHAQFPGRSAAWNTLAWHGRNDAGYCCHGYT